LTAIKAITRRHENREMIMRLYEMKCLVAVELSGKGETLLGAKWRRSKEAYFATKQAYGFVIK
jgi:hypothetical protein